MQDPKDRPRPEDRDASDGVVYKNRREADSDHMGQQPDTGPTTDETLDKALHDTFPASDPPSTKATNQETVEPPYDAIDETADADDGVDAVPDEFAQKRVKPVVTPPNPD
ncbi:MAG: hypothetical protein NW215_15570 [Hyphomicrobiales bacterium]|nr:hypothetical protein [Hyphomicrobiales bacterium]